MEPVEENFSNYKEYHEYFMINHNGTTLLESAAAVTPPPAALLLCSVALPTFMKKLENGRSSLVLLCEFLILVVPLILTYTLLSDYIILVSLGLSLLSAVLLLFPRKRGLNLRLVDFRKWQLVSTASKYRPFVTVFRSYINVITCICILAVDFRVFPRRFAKTEVSGYGLMDLGAGLFVVANAMVSSHISHEGSSSSIIKAFKSSSPLFLLGCLRLISTTLVNYQGHVSEYGTHCNFFFILAVTRQLCAVLLSLVGCSLIRITVTFLVLGLIHEFSLSALGVREWVTSNEIARSDFISSNREGFVSLIGYVCLHFGGLIIFTCMRRKPRTKICHWISFWKGIVVSSVIMWIATHIQSKLFCVSRRVGDLGYIFWVLSYSLSLLALFLTVELVVSAFMFSRTIETKKSSEKVKFADEKNEFYSVPILLESVNYNGLTYFLLGNVLTGAVNMLLKTLTLNAWYSMFIINLYMFLLCFIIYVLFVNKIQVKFW